MIAIGVLLVLAVFGGMAALPGLLGLVAGVVLLDLGFTVAMISHQAIILSLDDQARSRINTILMTALFFAGALGSAGASLAWRAVG